MKEGLFEQNPTINEKKTIETEKMQESFLIPKRALEKERKILYKPERLQKDNKMKHVITALMLVSTLVFGTGTFEAHAAEKKQKSGVEQVDKKRSREQIAINLLEQLSALPDNPRITNLTQQYALKRDAAQALIQFYALQRKLGFPEFPEGKTKISGHVSARDIKGALDELNVALGPFIDKKYGNKDGKIDSKELKKALETIKGSPEIINGNPGLEELIEMIQQYSNLPNWIDKNNN